MNNFDSTAVIEDDDVQMSTGVFGDGGAASLRQAVEPVRKYRHSFLVNVLKSADVVALLLAGFGGYFMRFGFETPVASTNHLFIYLSTIVTIVALHLSQAYRSQSVASLQSLLSTLFVGTVSALFLLLICGYLSQTLQSYSRLWLVSSAVSSFVLLVANRIVIARVVYHARKSDMLTESIVVVGATERAEMVIDSIRGATDSNIKILGVFDDRVMREMPMSLRPHMLGSTTNLLNFIRYNHVDRVVVALPWIASDRIDALLKKLRTVPVRIDLVPSSVVWQFPAIAMERLGNVPVLTVANGRVNQQMGITKRMEDLVISCTLLLLLSPLLLFIALLIKLDSKGPALFKQQRHGFNNRIFNVYKFRSMTAADSADKHVVQATKNDRRVTRVGRFLRRSSLDELPQLLNVFLGHMSIVGPRPHAVQHNVEFGAVISEYYARHNVKPGITGWAQIHGLRGETDTIEKMHSRVEYDLHYIEHWSLPLDIKIILMTAFSVWFQDTAY